MSATQGVFDALFAILDLLLNYGLVAASAYYFFLISLMEGGSYLGASLNIAFICLLSGLTLAPNPHFIPGSSSILRLLGHASAKVLAIFVFLVGHSLLTQAPPDTIFLQELSTICMAACLALILPIMRLEATEAYQVAMRDNALDTSDTTNAADPSVQEGDTPIVSAGSWKKLSCYIASWLVIMTCLGFIVSQATLQISADGTTYEPMIVNDTFLVNDTIIINDTCPLPLEVPTGANLTLPSITVPIPDFITTLGTPCQFTPTPAAPVAKPTWAPAAMSTPMPTPEPTPTALPEVQPEPQPEPQPQPEAVAAPQDVFGAFELFINLFISEAKSILSPQAISALSWYFSLQVEDQAGSVALALVLAFFLFSRLVAAGTAITAPIILPLTCLLSTGVFFCLQYFGVPRSPSLIICVVLFVALISALLTVAFLAHLLYHMKVVRSHATELPRVKSDVSRLADNFNGAEIEFDDFKTTTKNVTRRIDRRCKSVAGFLGDAISSLCLMIGALAESITAVESRGRRLARRIKSLEDLIHKLEANQANPEDIKKLQKELEHIKTLLDDLKNNAAGVEALRKLEEQLQTKLDELSVKVADLEKANQSTKQQMEGLATKDDLDEVFDNVRAETNQQHQDAMAAVQNQGFVFNQRLHEVEDANARLIDEEIIAYDEQRRAETDQQHQDAMAAVQNQGFVFNQRLHEVEDANARLIIEKINEYDEQRRAEQAEEIRAFCSSMQFMMFVNTAMQNNMMVQQANSNGNPPDVPQELNRETSPSPSDNTQDDQDSSDDSTDSSPDSQQTTSGNNNADDVEAPPSPGSDPPDIPPGLNPGGHSQSPNEASPGPSSSEADGSRASNGSVDDSDDEGSNGGKKKNGRRITAAQARINKRHRKERIALNGSAIIDGGDVVDEAGHKLAHVSLRPGLTGDLLSLVGSTVVCNTAGYIEDETDETDARIARVWLPDEDEYPWFVPKKSKKNVQNGAEDEASNDGSSSGTSAHDGASSQSSSVSGPWSAARDPSPSSDPTDPSPAASRAGPSSDGPGSSPFPGPAGYSTSSEGRGLPSAPIYKPSSFGHPSPAPPHGGPGPAPFFGQPGPSWTPGDPNSSSSFGGPTGPFGNSDDWTRALSAANFGPGSFSSGGPSRNVRHRRQGEVISKK